jgi:putative ABC transport system permease protein
MKMLLLALRTLRREWHLPELRTLAASLVLAVVALGVVATLSTRIERGMLASAAELIGGDIGVSSPQTVPETFITEATQRGLQISPISRPSCSTCRRPTHIIHCAAHWSWATHMDAPTTVTRRPQARSISITAHWSR